MGILTTAIEEAEYWLELEGLLARFHHDLQRVRASIAVLDEEEIVGLIDRASIAIGGACCAAAAKQPSMSA